METNGSALRGEQLWIALATSSFPVPLSPVTMTVLVVVATVRIRRLRSVITGLSPTM